ncbi:MAG TPA: hypothetical protein VF391_12520 [Dermatophilaceae bacterium]|jgi:hypothetical protein
MGFMDKAREAAQQASAKAQQGLAQGQAKLDEAQTSRAADGLLRDLGRAFYAEQRSGGSRDDVVAALGAVDAHVAAHGPLGQTGQGSTEAAPQSPAQQSASSATSPTEPAAGPSAGSPAGTPAGSPSAGPPAPPPADPAASGGFTLDDI